MAKSAFIASFLLGLSFHGISQKICDFSTVLEARLSNVKPLPYKGRVGYIDTLTGKLFGCGFNLGCFFSKLTIERAIFNETKAEIEIEGNYYFDYLPGKQQPFGFRIFAGVPQGRQVGFDTLQNVRELATIEPRVIGYNKDSSEIYSPGKFHIKFKIKENDRLYFDAGEHMYLAEYNVGCVIALTPRH